jgi:hypothetical protein
MGETQVAHTKRDGGAVTAGPLSAAPLLRLGLSLSKETPVAETVALVTHSERDRAR